MNSLMLATFGSIMMNILYVAIAIVVLLTMVLIHELGHYLVGRWLGFKITEFSIGFGKALWQKTNKRGELISFRVFPLGGYCAFYGETDDEEPENNKLEDLKQNEAVNLKDTKTKKIETKAQLEIDNTKLMAEKKFNDMPAWKRMLVFIAGVSFNFISAFVFAIIFLCVGAYDGYKLSPTQKDYYVNLYSVTETQEIIGTLEKDTIVYAINGKNINYARGKVFNTLVDSDASEIVFTIDLNGDKTDVLIKKAYYPVENDDGSYKNEELFGISYSTVNLSYGFGDVLRDFVPFTFNISVVILKAFWQIITGQIAINQLGGPISTITQISEVASYGIANFLYLLPLLAANLAIFNLLPIPGLDGAHVVFAIIEIIRRKPIKREVENAIHGWGILALFAFVIIIDIVHLITV